MLLCKRIVFVHDNRGLCLPGKGIKLMMFLSEVDVAGLALCMTDIFPHLELAQGNNLIL